MRTRYIQCHDSQERENFSDSEETGIRQDFKREEVVVVVQCFWEVSHLTDWKTFTNFGKIGVIAHLNQSNFYTIWFRINYSGAVWSVSGTWDSEENMIRKKGICLISYGWNLLINPHWQTFKLFSLIVFMYFLSFFHIISWGYIFRNNYHHHHITIITVGQQVWVYYGLEHRMVWSTPVFICIWGYILFSKFCYS